MKPIAFAAMVGVIAVAFCEPAAARGFGGSGGAPPGGLNGPGMHAFRGGGIRAAMPPPSVGGRQFANSRGPRSFGGRQVAMNGNLRSNRGGLRRGHERAAYVHRLNNERRDTGETDGRTRTTGTNATGRGGTTSAGSSAGGTTATGGATSGTSGSSTATGSGRHSALAPLSR
jgi:hypothetical protein